MRRRLAFAVLLLAAACQLRPQTSRNLAPLETEGEVYLYLEAMPREAERLTFTLASVGLASSDGGAVPVQLLLSTFPGEGAETQRMLAMGHVPPGSYAGLLVGAARATLATAEGSAQLLVPKEPVRLAAPFMVTARHATVLSLTFRYATSVEGSFSFTPDFGVTVPPRPMPPLQALSPSTAWNDVFFFDKRQRRVVGVLPTGRGARGVALSRDLLRGYVALTDEDQVEVIDVPSGGLLPRFRLAVGDAPRELALSGDGRTLLVLNGGSNSVAFLDAGAGTELGRVTVGEDPGMMLLDRTGRRAYVLNRRSSTLSVVDLATRSVVATAGTETDPLRAQLDRAGTRLYLIHGASPYLLVLSLPDLRVLNRVFVGLGASALKVDARSDLVYVGKDNESRLYVYDPTAFIPIDYVEVPDPVSYLAIDDAENTLLAVLPARRAIAVLDLSSRQVLATVAVGEDPYTVALAGERF